MRGSFIKHLRMGTTRIKRDKATEDEGKKRDVSVERSKVGTKNESPDDCELAYHRLVS